MAVFITMFVFVYGIIEKDFWWALRTASATFFFCFLVEMIYALLAFTAMFNAIEAISNFLTRV